MQNQIDQILLNIFGADAPAVQRPSPQQDKSAPPPKPAKVWDLIKLAHRVNTKYHNGFNEQAFCERFNMKTYQQTRQKVA